jgi:hypothetical protein
MSGRMVVACIYHWYMAGLYASPVILLGGWVYFSNRRHRRQNGGGPSDGGTSAGSGAPAPNAG